MTDDAAKPDWRRLPLDPQGFFDLPDGFDRKQLKRSYNRFIRAFKPETHPAEFQRIRAAYEELDLALRYGDTLGARFASHSSSEAQSWASPAAGTSRPAPRRGQAAPQPAPGPPSPALHERVAKESIPKLYAELQKKPDKSPYDFYALALMSDVCDRRDGLQFCRWLLAGIRTFPGNFALQRLLHAYLGSPLPPKALPKLLIATAKAIGRDVFYPMTEPAWDALLREESLDAFVSTLRQCEQHLRDVGISGKMVFTIRMLRTACWKTSAASPAAAGWAAEALEFIESNFGHIPPTMEFEVDLLGVMQEYLKVRHLFVSAGGLRARLDRTLQDFFSSDQLVADAAVVEQQLELAADADGLLDAFPIKDDPAVEAFYALWGWVSYEVAERCCEPENEEVNTNLWAGRVHALLVQLEAKTDSSALGKSWNWAGALLRLAQAAVYIATGLTALILCMTIALSIGDQRDSAVLIISVVVSTTAAVLAGFFVGGWLSKLILEKLFHPFCFRMAAKCYRSIWRRDALDLLGRSRLPFNLFNALLNHTASNQISTSIWVTNMVSQDYALALYAMAIRHIV